MKMLVEWVANCCTHYYHFLPRTPHGFPSPLLAAVDCTSAQLCAFIAASPCCQQVLNTFCDVAQFLLQSPQLPFYDYFGRASPPKRSCKSNFLKFLLRHAHTRTQSERERERMKGGHARSGNALALPARHSTAFENQYDCDYAALAVAVCVGVFLSPSLCVCVCRCVYGCVCVCRWCGASCAHTQTYKLRAVSKKSLRLVVTLMENDKRHVGKRFADLCTPLPLSLPCRTWVHSSTQRLQSPSVCLARSRMLPSDSCRCRCQLCGHCGQAVRARGGGGSGQGSVLLLRFKFTSRSGLVTAKV